MKRMLTIVVPEQHMTKANHLGMCKGWSEADGLSYRGANWQDDTGNKYSTTSLMNDMFKVDPFIPCTLPDWDEEGQIVDVTQALQAQSLITVYTPSDPEQTQPDLGPNKIIVVGGPKPLNVLKMFGLTNIESEEPL